MAMAMALALALALACWRPQTFKYRRLSESVARDLFSQIVRAVAYAHQHNITHRDIKLENILIARWVVQGSPPCALAPCASVVKLRRSHAHPLRFRGRACLAGSLWRGCRSDGTPKVADFGLSLFIHPDAKLQYSAGSLCYFAPEMVKRETHRGAIRRAMVLL
jgi:serine/threonine protein kinase